MKAWVVSQYLLPCVGPKQMCPNHKSNGGFFKLKSVSKLKQMFHGCKSNDSF
jgi:hypothetical protein